MEQKNPPVLQESELVLNPNGSVYHLALQPDQIADTLIIVGDPGRVQEISRHFDEIQFEVKNREFLTHTGTLNGRQLSVLSTGIGTDNIDIVLNELDALVNIDLKARKILPDKKSLKIVRLGTSGALQEDLDVDSFVLSSHAIGLDGVMNFYDAEEEPSSQAIKNAFVQHMKWSNESNFPYAAKASDELLHRFGDIGYKGITITANGFYGPQGRKLRLPLKRSDINEKMRQFEWQDLRIANYEMETSALYGLGGALGHQVCTVCAIIANRYQKAYSQDYHATIQRLIRIVLERLTA